MHKCRHQINLNVELDYFFVSGPGGIQAGMSNSRYEVVLSMYIVSTFERRD